MMLKYFSEKVSPAVHDKAAKKEGFGMWKESWIRVISAEKERYLKKQAEEVIKEREVRGMTTRGMLKPSILS
jgi:hypothetical protein